MNKHKITHQIAVKLLNASLNFYPYHFTDWYILQIGVSPIDHALSNTEEREPDCFLTKKKKKVIPFICAYTEESNSGRICEYVNRKNRIPAFPIP